jgi:uncharacterized protein (DUF1778 family)
MASVVNSPSTNKTARIEFRLQSNTKELYEQAAQLKRQTLTQWVTSILDDAAQKEIAAAQKTHLSGKNFDAFAAALDEPIPSETKALLAKESPWD